MPEPEISVVVPTRDRPGALDVCLSALDAQTAAGRLEVIVVDDGSVAAGAVALVVARHSRARLVRHERPAGPAEARNAGARAGAGAILCFTDDDCVPEPEWAERLTAAIRRGAEVVAGTTVGTGSALSEAAELIALAPAALEPFAPSNNLACTKALFDAIPFDTSYRFAAGEDREWCAHVAAAGRMLQFERDARVEHRQHLTTRTFLARQIRYGVAAYQFRGGRVAPARFYAALLSRAFARSLAVGALVAVAQVATTIGFIRAWLADRKDAR